MVISDDVTDESKWVSIKAGRVSSKNEIFATHIMPNVNVEIDERNTQVDQSVKDASTLLKSLEIKGGRKVSDSKTTAKNKVDAALKSLTGEFEDWRYASLHDPEREAATAAYKAARPYEKALMKIEKSIAEHQQQAEFLNNQALGLQDLAKATALGAVAKQAAVDLKGAQADMMTAHHMMAQAGVMGARAFKLNEKAKLEQINVPAYKGAAQMAAASAAHRYAPGEIAPPPVSAKAFNPPAPPTSVSPGSPPPLWPMADK